MNRIVRWNPIREIAAMQSAMDRLFDETWRSVTPAYENGNLLALDVHETAEAYTVVTSLPGLKADDIELTYHDHMLTIGANIAQPELAENVKVLVNERVYGKFSRSITLPQPVESDNISAEYHDGVLTLTLPKTPEVQPRNIPIRTLPGTVSNN